MSLNHIKLKKGEDRRIRAGHPWIFSNEIDTAVTPLKSFTPGEEVLVEAHDKSILGVAYVNPHSLIAGRIFSRDPTDRLDTRFLKERLTTALELRARLYEKPFYRLVYSEADGLPGLVVDRFSETLVVQINTAGMELKKDNIKRALRAIVPKAPAILWRNDSQVREQEGLKPEIALANGNPQEVITIEENGASFFLPLFKGQKTGWFYDHRANRNRLRDYVVNHTVLDVFSYLGGWGIQAAAFGARKVDCIESSAFAAEYIKKNAQLNAVSEKVNVLCEDAFDAMKKLLHEGKKYHVIVLDPPAFVKRSKDHKEGLLAYQRLNEMAIKLLVPGGILVTCSCSMHVSLDDLMQMLSRVAYRTQSTLQVLERGHQSPDHPIHIAVPESDYLKAIFVRKI